MESAVVATLISAGTSVVGFFVHGWILGDRIEAIRAANAKSLAEYASTVEERATYQTHRREQMEVLLNAASIAHSACRELSIASAFGPNRQGELFSKTVIAFQQVAAFLDQVSKAELNVYLSRKDIEVFTNLQALVMMLFFSLDLDDSGKPDYINKIEQCCGAVHEGFESCKVHYLGFKEQLAAKAGH